ncbi:hypothetical protein AALP_AA8G204200 [Arabis alpina]|uniref:Cystatin domain-containing protein n=1 Tax=Arabis alpina TaxID=50452 RepID=A0A087G8A9_ARAAL|nr:hypothetical protein AALP_AA8G204200 [Arabis alpina]
MPSTIDETNSDPPKRQKMEETTADDSDSDESDMGTPEEIQRFYDEYDKSQGFEMDFSKFTFCFDWKQLDLEDDDWVQKNNPDQTNNRDLIAMLCNVALTKHNEEKGTNLKLGQVLNANYHLAAAVTFYISFQVIDPCDGNQTKPYRAVVGYLPGRILVKSCNPRPSE